ncbi:P-type conjugative transfer protein VirB9 [Oligella ureolytica]
MNRLVHGAIAVAAACTLVAPVLALDLPKLSSSDHRVRYASYSPSDVIQLDAMIGVATVIVLEPDEQYEFHVFGDSDAYEFTHHRNHLFSSPSPIKPTAI